MEHYRGSAAEFFAGSGASETAAHPVRRGRREAVDLFLPGRQPGVVRPHRRARRLDRGRDRLQRLGAIDENVELVALPWCSGGRRPSTLCKQHPLVPELREPAPMVRDDLALHLSADECVDPRPEICGLHLHGASAVRGPQTSATTYSSDHPDGRTQQRRLHGLGSRHARRRSQVALSCRDRRDLAVHRPEKRPKRSASARPAESSLRNHLISRCLLGGATRLGSCLRGISKEAWVDECKVCCNTGGCVRRLFRQLRGPLGRRGESGRFRGRGQSAESISCRWDHGGDGVYVIHSVRRRRFRYWLSAARAGRRSVVVGFRADAAAHARSAVRQVRRRFRALVGRVHNADVVRRRGSNCKPISLSR